MSKLSRLNKTIPKIYNPLSNTYVKAILESWAQEFEESALQCENAKKEVLVNTADGKYLERLGLDRGVVKPILVALDDDDFRNFIVKLSYTPKQIRRIMYDVLDIFWGPTYSRANLSSGETGPFDLGTPVGLTGTVSFIANNVIVSGSGTLFTSELSENDFIRLSDDDNSYFTRIVKIIDDETLVIATPMSKDKSGSAVAITPYILNIKVDNNDESELILDPSFIVDTSNADVSEIVLSLNNNLTSATFSKISISNLGSNFLNLRTNTVGLLGKIQVTGGTANSLFNFDTNQNTIYDLENRTFICEINPREIVLNVPNLVGKLSRGLTGAAYVHNPISIEILTIDDTAKEITATADRSLTTDELAEMIISQDLASATISGNTSGTSITISFSSTSDLSAFVAGDSIIIDPTFCTSFVYDPKSKYSLTSQRTVTTESISIGDIKPFLSVDDAADIPDSEGFLCFDFGKENQENLVPYVSRPNNSTLEIKPSYNFKKAHDSGCIINFVTYGSYMARKDTTDYAAYLTDTVATLEFVKGFIDFVKAAGVVLRWIIDYPVYRF